MIGRPAVDRAVLDACTRVSPWKSITLCVALAFAAVLTAWTGGRGSGWALAVPAFFVMGAIQHHLVTLDHEGAHRLLHPNRVVNDLVADLFGAIPFFNLTSRYRAFHLTHHRFTGSPARDPEVALWADQHFRYERRGLGALVTMLLRDLFFVNLVRTTIAGARIQAELAPKEAPRGKALRDGFLYVVFWGPLVALSVHFSFLRELLVFWILPEITILFFLVKLHAYGEHTGATGPTEMDRTFVHELPVVTNAFLYPIASGYHLEHHLFPAVPWYNIGKLRRALLADTAYSDAAERVTVRGYLFGSRSVLRAMLLGEGQYRHDALRANVSDRDDDIAGPESAAELRAQLEP